MIEMFRRGLTTDGLIQQLKLQSHTVLMTGHRFVTLTTIDGVVEGVSVLYTSWYPCTRKQRPHAALRLVLLTLWALYPKPSPGAAPKENWFIAAVYPDTGCNPHAPLVVQLVYYCKNKSQGITWPQVALRMYCGFVAGWKNPSLEKSVGRIGAFGSGRANVDGQGVAEGVVLEMERLVDIRTGPGPSVSLQLPSTYLSQSHYQENHSQDRKDEQAKCKRRNHILKKMLWGRFSEDVSYVPLGI